MKLEVAAIVLLSVGGTGLGSAAGQSAQRRPQDPTEVYSAATTAILVDVVVRDSKGQPVTNLTRDDFTLSEDGVRQEIGSFGLASRGVGLTLAVRRKSRADPSQQPSTDGAPLSAPSEFLAPPRVVAIAFDRLSPEARIRALEAAQEYLKLDRRREDRIGIFTLDLALKTLEPYTDDVPRLRLALQRVASEKNLSSPDLGDQLQTARERLQRADQRALEAQSAIRQGGGGAAQVAPDLGSVAAEQAFAEMQTRMLLTADTLDREERGYVSTDGLLALVESLRLMPGRKTLIFFSEGLSLPSSSQSRFRSIIDLANRFNVSIYAVDASGLRTESTSKEARRELDAAAQQRRSDLAVGRDTRGALTQIVERNEDVLATDPHIGLEMLARDTAGLMIRDTNDLGAGFRRIDEDMRFHYLLSYSPSNQAFDGRFRTIEVKVRQPKTQVFWRRGYFAVRTPALTDAVERELHALAALDGVPVPHAFPMRAAGFVFPERSGAAKAAIVVDLRTDAVGAREDTGKQVKRAEFVVAARVKDARGESVRTFSQQYGLTWPLDGSDAQGQGHVLFYKEPTLGPGVYTLETVVYDSVKDQSSVRIATIEVPDAAPMLVSSLVLVGRAERVPQGETRATSPLYVDDLLIYPNLGEPIARTQREVAFYFALLPGGTPPKASVQLARNGTVLADLQVPLRLAAPTGEIRQVGRLPIESLPAGRYDLTLTVRDSSASLTRLASFEIID